MGFFSRAPRVEQLKVVIVGAGEVGYHIAHRLAQESKEVVIIDQSAEALRRVSEVLDVQTFQGSGSSPVVLSDAGVMDADIFLAVTDSDEINIISCLFANAISPDSIKIARIRNEEYNLYQDALTNKPLNISTIINPEIEVIKAIDRMLAVPGAVDFSEFAEGRVKLVGIRVEKGPLVGKKLMAFREIVPDTNVLIAAIVRGEDLIIPSGRDEIVAGDVVYFACKDTSLEAVRKVCGRNIDPVRDVLIIGGGNIGLRLAVLFERKGLHVKLVDRSESRCQYLAEKLNSTLVLRGDGTDQDFLREENVGEMDVVISLTSDEETNILSSLLAKNLGAKKTVTRVNKVAYQPLVNAIGIDHSVSPRLSAVNSILHHIRRGKVLSSVSIRGEGAEALEAIAQADSELVGKPVKDLPFPRGTLLLAIVRGKDVVIPSGDSMVQPEDRIIILTTRENVSRVEQALTVTLKQL
ncbi:Trk system potassium transporter TrkA [Desulfovibrio mangrovi]|uniref:Trk system potassium transporter TrkA n=1 Tax=Desulfovibrio mangrovi TaxID=2976983 RepID=UPI002245B397|nr:Trk system potassium transporter TrkA [Desulfovibrio mangrovi]UZP68361.1 Trk system potassium transporter TrkA [Desulfovibrio mangrovi]